MTFSKSHKYLLFSFILLFFLFSAGISLLLFFAIKEGKDYETELLKVESKALVSLQHDSLISIFTLIVNDIRALLHSHELQKFSKTRTLSRDLTEDLIYFSKTKKIYDQIRYLDASGQERLRVNLNNGKPLLVPEHLLQNKKDRYYFKETMALQSGEIYISPFVLNIEQGVIEVPRKPVIRFGAPVVDENGKNKGIIIVNYLGQHLLDQLNTSLSANVRLMLVNSDGYFLKSHNKDDEWGFMYDDKEDRTFAKMYPTAWQEMTSSDTGQFYYENGLITFATLYPLQEMHTAHISPINMQHSKPPVRRYHWKILSHVQPENFHFVSTTIQNNMLGIFIFLGIIPFILAGAVAAILTKKRAGILQISQSEKKYKKLVENLPAMVYKANTDWTLALAHGLEELIHYTAEEMNKQNKKWTDIIHEDDLAPFLETVESSFMQSQNNFSHSYRIYTKDGHIKWAEDHKSPIFNETGVFVGYEGVIFDTTDKFYAENEKEALSDRLQHAQKMEAVGVMAGGIAHDFNNILAGILGYASMAKDDLPENSRIHSDLEQVIKAANRAKDLVEQILVFSKKNDQKNRAVEISPLIKEAVKLIRASIPSSIEINHNISPKTSPVLADPSQIHQILMNLCANATQAMNGKGIMEITLIDAEMLPGNNSGLNPGIYIHLSVSDTGPGIGPDVKKKIFDPFFTTKEVGKGTGMGLTVVYGIIEQYSGLITVESEPDVRTTFHVYLPAILKKTTAINAASVRAVRGKERILIVDDDEMIAKMNKKILEKHGYRVTAKTDPIEALELLKSAPNDFDLIITDQTMPHLNGIEFAAKIALIKEDIPIILCSGYIETIEIEMIKKSGVASLLKKPFKPHELINQVQKITASIKKTSN